MPDFRVQRYDGADQPVGEPMKLPADNAQAAAEKACGETLSPGGKPGQLRATVSTVIKPGLPVSFFALPRKPT